MDRRPPFEYLARGETWCWVRICHESGTAGVRDEPVGGAKILPERENPFMCCVNAPNVGDYVDDYVEEDVKWVFRRVSHGASTL
jgi:hypothetical protein